MEAEELKELGDIPADNEGPVFAEPWQAQAFALAVQMQREGLFTWSEWGDLMGESIEAARADGDPDLGNTYYLHWLATLEKISSDKGLCSEDSLLKRKALIDEEHKKLHGHGH